MVDDARIVIHTSASRTPDGCAAGICDYVGDLDIVPSAEAATDGEDYIEGNAGDDLIFGDLGQDDIVGGSSTFFSLTTRLLRPDGSDLIFGGSGTRIGRDDDTTLVPGATAADIHARDADTIAGDNANIIRIVGMPTLIGYAIRRSLAGLEWAAGIPGTVGGCLVMNAGTRLGEMKDSIKAVRIVTAKGDVRDLSAASIRFDYRRAHLPKGIVVGVWLQLRPGIRAEIARIVKDYLHYRKDTQPLAMPSAGCVFKNPPRDSAGRLLEAAGLKGMRIGDAEVSTKHGNFIVNRGHASAADVIGLIQKVRRMIKRKTGVRLDLELKIVGEA